MLFSAPGCGLCVDARRVLERLRERLGFELVEVDISGDDELERRYRIDLPVIEVGGQRVCTITVVPSAVERALTAAQARGVGGAS